MTGEPPPLPNPQLWPQGHVPARGVAELAGYGRRLLGRVIDIVIGVGAPSLVWFALLDTWGPGSLAAFYGLTLGFAFLNDVVLTAVAGGTIGKLAIGTRVVRVEDWHQVRAGTAMRRWAAMMILNLIPFGGLIDNVWIFSGEMQQTLHDKFAETTVVRSQS